MIARELTKIHETFYRDDVEKIKLTNPNLKGELTVVISKKNNKTIIVDDINIKKQAMQYLKKYSVKDVVELISKKEKIPKKQIYKICLTIKKNEKDI